MRNGNADAAQWVYEEASQAVEWYVIHGGSYGKQKAAYHLRKLADKLDQEEDIMDTPTDGSDEIIVQDDNSGDTYVFRGGRTYKVVDGKEVLVPNKVDKDAQSKRDKTTSD